MGKGCSTFLGLLVFLAIALVAGTFWGIHYLRGYSSPEPLPIPVVEEETSAAEPAVSAPPVVAAQPVMTPPIASVNPTAPPTVEPTQMTTKPLMRDWKTFEKAAKRGEPARIELTASEINTLIANSNGRGKVFVEINNDVAQVQVSIPLKGIYALDGRYLNGTLTVESSPDGDPAKARIANITANGRPVPNSFIDQGLFGWPSLRTVVADWLNEQNIGTFQIENNRAIGETR